MVSFNPSQSLDHSLNNLNFIKRPYLETSRIERLKGLGNRILLGMTAGAASGYCFSSVPVIVASRFKCNPCTVFIVPLAFVGTAVADAMMWTNETENRYIVIRHILAGSFAILGGIYGGIHSIKEKTGEKQNIPALYELIKKDFEKQIEYIEKLESNGLNDSKTKTFIASQQTREKLKESQDKFSQLHKAFSNFHDELINKKKSGLEIDQLIPKANEILQLRPMTKPPTLSDDQDLYVNHYMHEFRLGTIISDYATYMENEFGTFERGDTFVTKPLLPSSEENKSNVPAEPSSAEDSISISINSIAPGA